LQGALGDAQLLGRDAQTSVGFGHAYPYRHLGGQPLQVLE
jgi:hypothetical protein